MSDDLFPAPDNLSRIATIQKSHRLTTSKTELVRILWVNNGLRNFREGKTWVKLAKFDGELRLRKPGQETQMTYEELTYELQFTQLGREKWAYVVCNDVVVVPPFEFHGWEYLPSQPW